MTDDVKGSSTEPSKRDDTVSTVLHREMNKLSDCVITKHSMAPEGESAADEGSKEGETVLTVQCQEEKVMSGCEISHNSIAPNEESSTSGASQGRKTLPSLLQSGRPKLSSRLKRNK